MDYRKTLESATAAMRGLADQLNRIALGTSGVPMKSAKRLTRKEKKKTQKDATHKVNPVFRARKIASVTPAKFRRMNLGMIRDLPNWKKPHAAPKWRNRWISPLS